MIIKRSYIYIIIQYNIYIEYKQRKATAYQQHSAQSKIESFLYAHVTYISNRNKTVTVLYQFMTAAAYFTFHRFQPESFVDVEFSSGQVYVYKCGLYLYSLYIQHTSHIAELRTIAQSIRFMLIHSTKYLPLINENTEIGFCFLFICFTKSQQVHII